jgi:hypothetical protein
MDAPQDLLASLNATKILVAALETLGSIEIPALTFLDAGVEDRQLSVTYDDKSSSFIFKLGSKNESNELINDFE